METGASDCGVDSNLDNSKSAKWPATKIDFSNQSRRAILSMQEQTFFVTDMYIRYLYIDLAIREKESQIFSVGYLTAIWRQLKNFDISKKSSRA